MDCTALQCEQAEPFVQATIDTFKTMLRQDVRRKAIVVRKGLEVVHDVSGMIGLTGEEAEGCVSLGFDRPTAMAVASSFLCEEKVSVELMADTVGELVNIISGFAGKDLKSLVRLSLPTIILGDKHAITTRRSDLQTVTVFESPLGNFHLYVFLENSAAEPKA